jgi:hypothetical protein
VKTFRFMHRWLGITAILFILLFAVSGIVLNHRSFFSVVDINRKYLPKTYSFQNWNLAAVKSATPVGKDSLLIFGNTGIWLTDSTFSAYKPFHNGLTRGADNRRTHAILKTDNGMILAGTMAGLYYLEHDTWKRIHMPVKEKRITGMTETYDGIWVMTRSHLLRMKDPGNTFEIEEIQLPYPIDFKRETSMFRALWVIHSGEILGLPGKLFTDIMGLIMIFLCISGIVWFMAPDVMRSLRKKFLARKRFARLNRFSLKWHNKLGIWTLIFMIVLTITGMFLRPPLLIPIVQKSFPAIKHTILDHPNPWHDKLRDIKYDRLAGKFLLSTSSGFYYANPDFNDSLRRVPFQPPISVMGINVFEQPEDGVFITGSFSGIHRWIPSAMQVHDFITGLPVAPVRGMAHPFGNIPVAGYIHTGDREYLFDYNAGIFSLNRNNPIPRMPDEMVNNSNLALWNLALEVHTGRFYSFFLGDYYILFIPLMGLVILIILVSGGVLWFKNYKRQKRLQKSIPEKNFQQKENGESHKKYQSSQLPQKTYQS